MNIPIAIIDKRIPKENVSEIMNIIGDIEGKKVILIDDMIDTAGTITNAANALKERGAEEVYACCTHAVLSGPAIERIENSAIKELTVADIFADAINRIHEGISVSKLFDIEIKS